MAIEDDCVLVDAKLLEGDPASQPRRPRAHDCDFVESRSFRCTIPSPSIVPFTHEPSSQLLLGVPIYAEPVMI